VVVPLKRLILLAILLNGNGCCHCVAGVAVEHRNIGENGKTKTAP
jgi:hypothetical protein